MGKKIIRLNKFREDEYFLFKRQTPFGNQIWVGKVLDIDDTGYFTKCLSDDIQGTIKIWFKHEFAMSPITKDKVSSVISTVRLLYDY